jgi:hypothetical protein
LKSDHKTEEPIRQYLLGQATPEDSSRFEEQLLTDEALFQELLAAEDELVDDYLGDKLSPTDRQSFENHFLIAPEHQRKLRFSRALHKYVELAGTPVGAQDHAAENLSDEKPAIAKPAPKRSFFSFMPFANPILSYSLAAVLLLMLGSGSWVIVNNWRQQTQSGNVFVATLTPGLTRSGGETSRFKLPPAGDTVALRLALPQPDYQTYRGVLLTANQSEVWASDDLLAVTESGTRFVVARVPASLLAAGDYLVKLRGRAEDGSFEEVDSYPFRVTR